MVLVFELPHSVMKQIGQDIAFVLHQIIKVIQDWKHMKVGTFSFWTGKKVLKVIIRFHSTLDSTEFFIACLLYTSPAIPK